MASANVIDGDQQGFEGWYAPENWTISDTSSVIFNDLNTEVTLNAGVAGDEKLTFGIDMPAAFQSADPSLYLTGLVEGDFNGIVEFSGITQAFIRTNAGDPQEESTPFTAGGWFAIVLDSGSLTLTNFAAPAAATVPEPGALALLGLGLVGLGASQVHRKRK